MKASFGSPPEKRIPESKKYAHVKSSIDTGASAKKQSLSSTSAVARRRDEIFKRVRPSTLARLLQEREVNESVFAMGSIPETQSSRESVASVAFSRLGAGAPAGAPPPRSVAAPSVASMHSVAGSVLSVVDSDATVHDSRDLVILDLREASEFDQCRLPLAVSYPATNINRDVISPELHRCKRDPSKLLVVYHTDEQSTAGVATLLVQKGWPTVHALSGGFEEMVQSYPEVLEGDIPFLRPDSGASSAASSSRSRARSQPGRVR